MELKGGKKRLLFIGLFIVPFLIAMALIFYGKTIHPLPKYFEKKITNAKGEKVSVFYSVPLKPYKNIFTGKTQKMSNSSTYIVVFFTKEKRKMWAEQILFISKILDQHKGAKAACFFEEDSSGVVKWTSDSPEKFIKSFNNWENYQVADSTLDQLYADFKLTRKEVNTMHFPPYVIIDRSQIIRAMVTVTDLKATREVVSRLKRLSNEYASEKKVIERKQ